MSFLDKLMFWKKEPELPSLGEAGNFGTGAPFKDELGLPKEEPFDEEPIAAGLTPPYPTHPRAPEWARGSEPARNVSGPSFAPQQQFAAPNRDIELVSAKLDAIKANLESINQRLANLERIAKESI